ncbi:Kinesin-like protein [Coniochaeta hoffmannii]|uniref:Kinesin-like protein n=1 Tax=Coniochaeta hoffmannii TaxID=91930 RepID=A0AA38VJP9_9PEZI|nr:Kinesin-like protein [Coniochaeta hoffmannii]
MTGLRQPTRYNIAAPSSALNEISDSQANARAAAAMPPPPHGLKRQNTDYPVQPDAKRKPPSLAERAGEYKPKSQLPPPRVPTAVATKATSIVNLTSKTPYSRASSTTSAHSRQNSTSSYAQSVAPGHRPQTSMGNTFGQSVNGHGRPRANTSRRPATAMGNRGPDPDTTTGSQSWDVDDRLHEVEAQFRALKDVMNSSLTDRKSQDEALELAKTRMNDLERERSRVQEKNEQLQDKNEQLREQIDDLNRQLQQLTMAIENERRSHTHALEDKSRDHRDELQQLRRELTDEADRIQKAAREAQEALERHYKVELEDMQTQKAREIQELRTRLGTEQQDLSIALQGKDREMDGLRSQMDGLRADLDREQSLKANLQRQMAEMNNTIIQLQKHNLTLKSQVEFLESDSKAQSDSFTSMEARLQEALRQAEEAKQKLIKEETERRVLFNKYQELKGNIRVMCRVRPVLGNSEGSEAGFAFPDEKSSTQIDVTGLEERSSLGAVTRKTYPFEFDRVFDPKVHNGEIFGEISQLVQSALDGYNVCIFCYGQTGSGKTYTMSSADGMIPRATHMIYETITKLEEKSWRYTMEGSFVEVYNEELRDLLTPAKEVDGKKKIEIRHDEARKQTTVTNVKTVRLDTADKVEVMLRQAQNNRSVAATKANERSSRSHSVFILKLMGENAATGERCEGTLNLVDLAGSERLNHSGAEGERMKETQNINKSLACLGDVIEALGKGSSHIPYRNSKLTHLLQYSLGGNSKTLMFVMVSPLEAHLKETLTSLRFATKVHNTHIGTAKSTKKTKTIEP